MEFERRKEHKRNEKLEELLKDINGLLGPVEANSISPFAKTKYPVILVMGSPRSGSTLMMQWLASSGHFSYPTNLLSRFYSAPSIGAKIQLMLTKYDFNKEIFDFNEEIPFASNLGKTKGALAPNEFWYFWRRFFKFGEIQVLDEKALKSVDSKSFVSELAAIESVFEKPFAMKGMILNWNIPFLSEILEKVLFIYTERHPFYNIQSLLESRINYYGDIKGWYSFKPPEYESLKDKDPYEQVAGQVFYTNRAIKEGLKKIDEKKYLSVCYEEFCQNPEKIFGKIREKLRLQGFDCELEYKGPSSFGNTNKVKLPDEDVEKVVSAYKRISGEAVKL